MQVKHYKFEECNKELSSRLYRNQYEKDQTERSTKERIEYLEKKHKWIATTNRQKKICNGQQNAN